MPINYHNLLIAHVIETLPQDIGQRRRLIEALIFTLPLTRTKVLRDLLLHLDRHINAQTELALILDQANSVKPITDDSDPNDNSGHRRKTK